MHLIKKTWEVEDINRLKSLVKELDLSGLENELTKRLNVPITLTIETNEVIKYNGTSLQVNIFQKKNLVSESGVFKTCFRSVRLEDFGVKFYDDVEYDDDIVQELQEKGEWDALKNIETTRLNTKVYITMDLRYYLNEGGSNGVTLLTCNYDFDKKEWNF